MRRCAGLVPAACDALLSPAAPMRRTRGGGAHEQSSPGHVCCWHAAIGGRYITGLRQWVPTQVPEAYKNQPQAVHQWKAQANMSWRMQDGRLKQKYGEETWKLAHRLIASRLL